MTAGSSRRSKSGSSKEPGPKSGSPKSGSHSGHAGIIRAAGSVVLRGAGDRTEVALVHRERYRDWTLPKGKLEPDELTCEAAVREVAEETGLEIRLGPPLDRVSYRLEHGDTKVVDYWIGHVVNEAPRPPDDEISAVEWLPVAEALARLSYRHDVAVVEQAIGLPPTTPLLVLRHAKAVKRSDWADDEATRPLTNYGQRQARRLRRTLRAFGVGVIHSSPWLRCHATVAPYAESRGLVVTDHPALTESAAARHPGDHLRTWQELRAASVRDDVPAAVCGHRPTLPATLEALGLSPRKVRTSEVVVIHLDVKGETVAHEWFRPASR